MRFGWSWSWTWQLASRESTVDRSFAHPGLPPGLTQALRGVDDTDDDPAIAEHHRTAITSAITRTVDSSSSSNTMGAKLRFVGFSVILTCRQPSSPATFSLK